MSNPAVISERPTALSEKAAVVVFVVGPFLALVGGICLFFTSGWIHPTEVGTMVTMYVVTAIGITIGFHRMLTHKGFQTYRGVEVALAILDSMACQGPVLNWTADHRRHHAHTDVEGDPHSPHLSGGGLRGTARGWAHSHIGWLFEFERSSKKKYVPDLVEDSAISKVHDLFLLWIGLSLIVIPFTVGWLVTGSVTAGLVTMLWAGLVRVFFVQHVTWSINSVCHLWGKRPFPMNERTGFSTNNLLVAGPSLGEAFHQNHHAFPFAAVHGFLPGQLWLDWSGLIILFMERLGLVWNVRRVSKESIEKTRSEESTFEPVVT